MARCKNCKSKSVVTTPSYSFCKDHFINYFEKKVLNTIKKFKLINTNDKIIVASSGGKDSTTILYIIQKYFKNASAIAIDEGIPGYRNITLEDLTKFCKSSNIPLKIYSYEHEFGFSITKAIRILKDLSPCYVCGILRRYLLNTKSFEYTKVATGHNMDDEAQSIMMNFVKSQTSLLARLGPKTGSIKDSKFVPRIKPLYFCSEKEVAAYAFLKNFGAKFIQCPHSHKAFRGYIRDLLNDYESKHKGAKQNLINTFLKLQPKLKIEQSGFFMNHCKNCSQPSSKEWCKACTLVKSITKI